MTSYLRRFFSLLLLLVIIGSNIILIYVIEDPNQLPIPSMQQMVLLSVLFIIDIHFFYLYFFIITIEFVIYVIARLVLITVQRKHI